MRKRLISTLGTNAPAPGHDWLQLAKAAVVEVTSEAEGYSIEEALLTDGTRGWRANVPSNHSLDVRPTANNRCHSARLRRGRMRADPRICAPVAPEFRRLLERYYSAIMEFQPAEHSA